MHTWWVIMVLLLESTLTGSLQGADMQCVRNFSYYPTTTLLVIGLFQLVSAILMLNMLIALSARRAAPAPELARHPTSGVCPRSHQQPYDLVVSLLRCDC